ncbi:hypothetical protein [Archangium sp.]|uniref:hypothetical protein n=1 Tax=Archangium sp. TaxID=1872627 RepID=UPI003899C2CC
MVALGWRWRALSSVAGIWVLLAAQAGYGLEVFGTVNNFTEDQAHSREPTVALSGPSVFSAWIDMRTGYGDVYFRASSDRGLTFGPARNLSTSRARASDVRLTRFQSNVYVAWAEDGILLRTSHDSGVTFGPLQVLSPRGSKPRVVATGGSVYVAWTGSDKEGTLLLRASHDSGDTFEAAIDLNEQARGGDLDLAAEGSHVYAVWDDGAHVYFRQSQDSGLTFAPPQVLDDGQSESGDARLATHSNGVYVVWREGSGCSSEIAFRRGMNGGTRFDPLVKLSQNAVASLDPLIDSHDTAVYVIWKEKREGSTDIFFTRSLNGGASFGAASNLSDTPGKSSQYALSSPGDTVRIVWREKTVNGSDIFYRSSTDRGASFGITRNLSLSPGKSTSPVIISSGRGAEVHVLWEEELPLNRELFYRRGVPEP